MSNSCVAYNLFNVLKLHLLEKSLTPRILLIYWLNVLTDSSKIIFSCFELALNVSYWNMIPWDDLTLKWTAKTGINLNPYFAIPFQWTSEKFHEDLRDVKNFHWSSGRWDVEYIKKKQSKTDRDLCEVHVTKIVLWWKMFVDPTVGCYCSIFFAQYGNAWYF